MLKNDDAVLYTCRSIYAEWVSERNPDTDRDVLMAQLLGHDKDDITSANSYQKVTLTDATLEDAEEEFSQKEHRESVPSVGRKHKRSEKAVITKKQQTQTSKLIKLLAELQSEADSEGRAVSGINKWAIEHLKQHPDAVFTQTMITKLKGSSRPAIAKWLKITPESDQIVKPGK